MFGPVFPEVPPEVIKFQQFASIILLSLYDGKDCTTTHCEIIGNKVEHIREKSFVTLFN